MKAQKPFIRFLIGLASLVVVLVVGFAWVAKMIPTWGATPAEVAMSLPGDDLVPGAKFRWDHAITIHATPEQIYPWLAQIGDTRGGYYSYSFIENLFQRAGKMNYSYINAGRVHPEWQNPPKGQGIIVNYLAIAETQPNQYVLATATPELKDFQWSWLWYLEPVDANTTRLIVRHRILFPPAMPESIIVPVFNAGYVMERGMILGIRDRAEGNIPPVWSEGMMAVLWLIAFVCGILAAIRYLKTPGRYHALGVGLEAVVFLIIFTFVQPAPLVEVVMDLVLVASLWVAYHPGQVTAAVRQRQAAD